MTRLCRFDSNASFDALCGHDLGTHPSCFLCSHCRQRWGDSLLRLHTGPAMRDTHFARNRQGAMASAVHVHVWSQVVVIRLKLNFHWCVICYPRHRPDCRSADLGPAEGVGG